MTASAEVRSADGSSERPFSARWHEETARTQAAALPSGRLVVSCSAPLGAGGLGRHLSEIVDALERAKRPPVCICGSEGPLAPASARRSPRHVLGLRLT